jgi:secondary thiamine-phosphate synthase enzyme
MDRRVRAMARRADGASIPLELVPLAGPGLACASGVLRVRTDCGPQFIDITSDVERMVASSKVWFGMAVVYSRHTTAAIKLNENEPLLIADMCQRLSELFPASAAYGHNDFAVRTVNMTDEEEPNGHAHCQHLLLSTSETIPIVEGRLVLGRWQRVFLVELDRARAREVVVSVLGVPPGVARPVAGDRQVMLP